ncbi:MAG: hypothetical protein ACRDKI_12665 [Solirubrobacterales bacterium]
MAVPDRVARSPNTGARARVMLLTDAPDDAEVVAEPNDDDRDAARALACCVSIFVARLPSPYREAITLVELEGLERERAI